MHACCSLVATIANMPVGCAHLNGTTNSAQGKALTSHHVLRHIAHQLDDS